MLTEQDEEIDQPAPLMTLARIKDSMRNTKHLAGSLVSARIQRHYFDPGNADDRMVYLVFSKTGKWLKQYYFEMPDTNAVMMIQRRLIEYAVSTEVNKAQPIIDSIIADKRTT